MIIFTHRGLEPSKKNFWPESSYEALKDHIERGFGIEFDPNFAKDGIVVSHDSTLDRITNGEDKRNFFEVEVKELIKIRYGSEKKGRIPLLYEILKLIEEGDCGLHAMHLKGIYQDKKKIDLLLDELRLFPKAAERIIIFDVKPEIAEYIKSKNKKIKLTPSVAHPYDIERYNQAVKGTLISIKDAIKHKSSYDWVWLDEWDLRDQNGMKKFYTKETFSALKSIGYKVSLVTPELHGTSPGLLGGEAHPDAINKKILFERIKEIISLKPDAVCTDYPEEVLNMLNK